MDKVQKLIGFKPCSSIVISGSTGSGKTQWVKRFIENIKIMFVRNPPVEIMFCYGVYQKTYDLIKSLSPVNIIFYEGIPTREEIFEFSENSEHKLIILDDLMHHAVKDQQVELLFTQYCHHRCLSCILIQQNLYPQGKCSRTITTNAQYLILFENIRDKNQIMYLGRQIYPDKVKKFVSVYNNAVKREWGYLILDLSHNVESSLRLRTNIFPNEAEPIAYKI